MPVASVSAPEPAMCYPVAAMPEASTAVTCVAYAVCITTVADPVSIPAVAYPMSVTVVSVSIMSVPEMPPVPDIRRSISVAVADRWRIAVAVNRRIAVTVAAATITIAAVIAVWTTVAAIEWGGDCGTN